ncbi:dethiobiotin synthase [Luteibacter jiangsuensis]|uniref:ATP-dependent dethiobiotin synthetase BioD n=1 Tax=Luteibacter jiangsuensis TaxID=637577 RepID=A0ABX0Q5L1_9GAMM|nr:dethiobiotin synthase [Luteibacter jiangsuensis]NID05026.1 dethiobiotin synthase [Luteibacter jiangsuensis]
MPRHLFVAGTDTGIGKTHGAQALVHAFRLAGERVAGMKPVASGSARAGGGGLRNQDALDLQAASLPPPDYALVNPIALEEAVAPHLAAARSGVRIAWPPLDAAFQALTHDYERVVVEGVGGWMVPLGDGMSMEDMPRRWDLDVVLVVGIRLGCISHARLTARAIEADGCRLAGWIANVLEPTMPLLEENIATLRECLPAPCLGVLPYRVAPASAAVLLDVASLA